MNFQKIKIDYTHENQVLSLILNAPKGNVLDKEMMNELNQSLEFAKEKNIKAIVFKGEGNHFSFGASVPEHQKEFAKEMLAGFHGLFKKIIEVGKPTFALVKGQCLGGGMELATFCNFVFASQNAVFGQPETVLSVFPPVASLVLPGLIGQAKADDLILSGRTVSANTAKEIGLVSFVSENPESELDDFLTKNILPKSTVALQFGVKASRFEFNQNFLKNIDALEKIYISELMETHDANEGINSFNEKRKPEWKNC